MLTIKLPKELDLKLSALARSKRRGKIDLVHEAIWRLIEDEDDLTLAEKAISSTRNSKPLRQLRKKLELDC